MALETSSAEIPCVDRRASRTRFACAFLWVSLSDGGVATVLDAAALVIVVVLVLVVVDAVAGIVDPEVTVIDGAGDPIAEVVAGVTGTTATVVDDDEGEAGGRVVTAVLDTGVAGAV